MPPSASDTSRSEDPATIYANAARSEEARNYDAAFRSYLRAAEIYLHLSRTTGDERHRAELKVNASKALGRAEKIKAARGETVRPVVTNPFSQEEQSRILSNSSTINGMHFPAWVHPSPSIESPTQPPLSKEQESRQATWQRVLKPEHVDLEQLSASPEQLEQRIVTDCSLCASISACLEHVRRFHSQLLNKILTRVGEGGIEARLFVNGCERRIAIDDRLPVASDGQLMCLTSTTNDARPALVEKAYMKLMDGYDFPGSNSCIDLSALIGWIPEHIHIRSPDFMRDRTWNRLLNGFNSGRCLATFGTSSTTPVHLEGNSLKAAHCYAVTDVRTDGDEWHVTILDPFVPDAPGLQDHEYLLDALNQVSIDEQISAHQTRTIQLSYEDACRFFDGLYLSWNPELFSHNLSFHGQWKLETRTPVEVTSGEDIHSAYAHLNLQVEGASEETEVWVLLSRHVVDTRDTSTCIDLHVYTNDPSAVAHDITPISAPSACTNSPHVLSRHILQPSAEARLVSIDAFAEGLGFTGANFTISAYSDRALSWTPTAYMPYDKQITGTFTQATAGGNLTHPSFMVNPQYRLRLHPPAATSASAAKARGIIRVKVDVVVGRDMPVNAMIIWAKGERAFEVAQNDVAMASGSYTYNFASGSVELRPGDYTLVISTYAPGLLGPYRLHLGSTGRFDLDPIPQEGAGMYTKIVRGEWLGETAAGGPSSGRYASNPTYRLRLPHAGQLKIRLQLVSTSHSAPLNATLFSSSASGITTAGALGKHVLTSGPFADIRPGVVTPQVSLAAGTYLLVPSAFASGFEGKFKIVVYSSVSGVVLDLVDK